MRISCLSRGIAGCRPRKQNILAFAASNRNAAISNIEKIDKTFIIFVNIDSCYFRSMSFCNVAKKPRKYNFL